MYPIVQRLFAMQRYVGEILYAALPLYMQRDCFRIRTHDQQVTKAQLYRCTKARPHKWKLCKKKKKMNLYSHNASTPFTVFSSFAFQKWNAFKYKLVNQPSTASDHSLKETVIYYFALNLFLSLICWKKQWFFIIKKSHLSFTD